MLYKVEELTDFVMIYMNRKIGRKQRSRKGRKNTEGKN